MNKVMPFMVHKAEISSKALRLLITQKDFAPWGFLTNIVIVLKND